MPSNSRVAARRTPEKAPIEVGMNYSRVFDAKDAGNRDAAIENFREALAEFAQFEAPKAELAKLGVLVRR